MVDKSYSSSASLSSKKDKSLTSSANLFASNNDNSYALDAVLIRTPQCTAPPASLLPVLEMINLHMDGTPVTNATEHEDIPTIMELNIYVKSC